MKHERKVGSLDHVASDKTAREASVCACETNVGTHVCQASQSSKGFGSQIEEVIDDVTSLMQAQCKGNEVEQEERSRIRVQTLNMRTWAKTVKSTEVK